MDKKNEKPEVIVLLKKAWNLLEEYMKRETVNFAEHQHIKESDARFIVCWEEADVPFQLGHFFYNVEDKSNFDFHLEMNMRSRNFEDYTFTEGLEKVKKKFKGKTLRVDFLIDDKSLNRLEVIGEVKYFRYSIENLSRGARDVITEIGKDFEKLRALRENGVCNHTVYVVMDYYYHRNEPKTWNNIQNRLTKMGNSGIKVLKMAV
jgi:hypothetical protein